MLNVPGASLNFDSSTSNLADVTISTRDDHGRRATLDSMGLGDVTGTAMLGEEEGGIRGG